MKKLVCASILALQFACTTSPLKNFQNVRMGMDRAEVLDLIGSPLRTFDHEPTKAWKYRFFDEQKNPVFKEIRFEKNSVVYIGEPHEEEVVLKRGWQEEIKRKNHEEADEFMNQTTYPEDRTPSTARKPDDADLEKEMQAEIPDSHFAPVQNAPVQAAPAAAPGTH